MARYHARLSTYLSTVALLIVIASTVLAQTTDEWVARAGDQYRAGDYAASADSYQQAIEAGVDNKTTFYNAACAAALAGRADQAFKHLDDAFAHEWRDVDHLLSDSDLDSLHGDARWDETVARCRQAIADYVASLAEPELYAELREMYRIDQALLRGEDVPELEGKGSDEMNLVYTARMKEIVEEYGWPVASMVGKDGANAAWLLVQHSDTDPAFQRQCLELMKAAAPGEVSPVDRAYLTDRVLVAEGKKQVYGTQFHTVDGRRVPRPIEDEAGVDARRAELGMWTMEEYSAIMNGER